MSETTLAATIESEAAAAQRYGSRLAVNPDLSRQLVSAQKDKQADESRWFHFREGFSSDLVRYYLERENASPTLPVLDPFAGSGTTLFTASDTGRPAIGIEMLLSSLAVLNARVVAREVDTFAIAAHLKAFREAKPWEEEGEVRPFGHLRITAGAFPADTERQIGRYQHEVAAFGNPADRYDSSLRTLLRFAVMCVLEKVSFTRKDGQYLRWDSRCPTRTGRGKPFCKGIIYPFTYAISEKLAEIEMDLVKRATHQMIVGKGTEPPVKLLYGSCLERIGDVEDGSIGAIITSPPYVNRYDYTRTYALEMAFIGITEEGLKAERQSLLTCTVENKPKTFLAAAGASPRVAQALAAAAENPMLTAVMEHLWAAKQAGELNNDGILRMVRGYFDEMAVLVFQCADKLAPGAPFVMVNDNVRYAGATVPVDLILSDIAEAAGLTVERIDVLPKGKGNSSQQMGVHGKAEVRKCVYVWRKPATESEISHV